ncbi:rRNA maturation RNase YbeY [Catenulispora sp. NF23]|uniref:Endoribonuclease YbeY n=1 Tax=Catenulispora pinistramenti TaxID=2705254 RepID=A0ABS5KTS6_9ACTN|nr:MULTISPECIES: rRNA maturation RNase YbeY [Catenulispora]MBS2536955.1 rRNA maturation RNase YbeY [Catenulispora pinistramenti]MBS2549463.1 rRNA maturation RNase YbeY [Catenulispora pinistramenti]
MSIDIANETDYGTEQGVDAEELVGVARYVLGEMGIHPMAELSILLVDTAAMEQLHIQWMDEPGPTDVLSFPMDELRPARAEDDNEPVPGLLGDVVLCPEVAEKQAKDAGHATAEELRLLTTHGILHLLGYDHAEPEEEAEMFGLQKQLLRGWKARSGAR